MKTMEQQVEEHAVLEDVVAALRLADDATSDYEQFGRVVQRILEQAPPTPDDNFGGVQMLLRLQREEVLTFEVS